MGAGASSEGGSFAGCDEALLKRASELAPKMPDDERVDTLNEKLEAFIAEAEPFEAEDDGDDYHLLRTTKTGIKMESLGKKKRAVKRFNRFKRQKRSCVLVKGATVDKDFVHGHKNAVVFMIGVAFGQGKCDLGILDERGNPYQIFNDDGAGGEDADDGDEDDDVDAKMVIWTATREGIQGLEFNKKKKAIKKFNKFQQEGKPCILVEDGDKITHWTTFPDQKFANTSRTIFIIGVAYGKEVARDLGPVADEAWLEDD